MDTSAVTMKELARTVDEALSRFDAWPQEAGEVVLGGRAARPGETFSTGLLSVDGLLERTWEDLAGSFLELMEEGAATLTLGGRIVHANRRFADITQRPLGELAHAPLRELVQPSDWSIADDLIRAGSRARETRELAMVVPHGSAIPVLATAGPLGDGKTSGVCLLISDLSAKRYLGGEARSLEEKDEEMGRELGDLSFAVDRNMRCTCWDKAFEKLTGISAAQAIGRSAYELFPDFRGSSTEKLYRKVMSSQQPRSFVDRYRVRGRDFFFQVAAYPTSSGLAVFVKDITVRRRSEESLAIQTHVLDSLDEAVHVFDDNGIIRYTNPAFDALFDCERGKLVNKHISILNFSSVEENARILGRIIEEVYLKGAWRGRLRNCRRDGSCFFTAAQIQSLEVGGKRYWMAVQQRIGEDGRFPDAASLAGEGEAGARSLGRLIERLEEGLVVADPSGEIISINAAARHLLGLGEGEGGLVRGLVDVFTRADGTPLPFEENPLGFLLRGETLDGLEATVRDKLGQAVSVLCRGTPVTGCGGEVILAVLSMNRARSEQLKARRVTVGGFTLAGAHGRDGSSCPSGSVQPAG